MAEYRSQVWRVDVREQTLKQEPVPESWKRLGGRARQARLPLDEVDAQSAPRGEGKKHKIAPRVQGGHQR